MFVISTIIRFETFKGEEALIWKVVQILGTADSREAVWNVRDRGRAAKGVGGMGHRVQRKKIKEDILLRKCGEGFFAPDTYKENQRCYGYWPSFYFFFQRNRLFLGIEEKLFSQYNSVEAGGNAIYLTCINKSTQWGVLLA